MAKVACGLIPSPTTNTAEKIAVKAKMSPIRTKRFLTKYKTTIGRTGTKLAITVVRAWSSKPYVDVSM